MWCGLYKLELSEHGVVAITQACETENINKKAQVNVISMECAPSKPKKRQEQFDSNKGPCPLL